MIVVVRRERRRGPAGGEDEGKFSQSKTGWDVTGDDGGPAPPGSNIRGVTAQLERPRRGPETS